MLPGLQPVGQNVHVYRLSVVNLFGVELSKHYNASKSCACTFVRLIQVMDVLLPSLVFGGKRNV